MERARFVSVVNRTTARAQALAARIPGVRAIEMPSSLNDVDVLVMHVTGAQQFRPGPLRATAAAASGLLRRRPHAGRDGVSAGGVGTRV